MLHISEAQVRELLNDPEGHGFDRVIDLLESAFRSWSAGTAANESRRRVRAPGGAMLHLMGAADAQSGYIGCKAYTTSRTGSNVFYVLLFDAATGQALALIEADYLGQIRTGAATGLATRYMARQDAHYLGVIGTGGQAFTQVLAINRERELVEIRVFSRNQERCRDFARGISGVIRTSVRSCETAREAVAGADMVVTATTSSEPVFFGRWIEPGMHISAVGGNAASRRELDEEAVRRADRIVADSIEQSRIESGELIATPRWEDVTELSAVVAGRVKGRDTDSEVTLFKSNGVALEDIVVAGWLYEQLK